MSCVYRHIRLDKNEPFYIGIGSNTYRATSKNNRNKHWKNIVSKTDYEVEILFEDLSRDKAIEKEIELIKLYGRKDLGLGTLCNMTDGGDGILGLKQSKEHIESRRKSMIGKLAGDKNPTKRPEVAAKISKATKLRHKYNDHPTAKKIINTKTLETYKSMAEAERKNNLKFNSLRPRLTGRLKNDTNLIYMKDAKS
jgi:hypothetical protein